MSIRYVHQPKVLHRRVICISSYSQHVTWMEVCGRLSPHSTTTGMLQVSSCDMTGSMDAGLYVQAPLQ